MLWRIVIFIATIIIFITLPVITPIFQSKVESIIDSDLIFDIKNVEFVPGSPQEEDLFFEVKEKP